MTQMLLSFKIKCNCVFMYFVMLGDVSCVVELELRMMKRSTNFRPFQW